MLQHIECWVIQLKKKKRSQAIKKQHVYKMNVIKMKILIEISGNIRKISYKMIT